MPTRRLRGWPPVLAGASLVAVPTIQSAGTPEQACQNGRYKAAAKYTSCHQRIIEETKVWNGRFSIIALVLATLCGNTPAAASTLQCQRAIAKANSQFVQAKAKALGKCEGSVVEAGGGSCPDGKTTTAIGKATAKLAAAIGKGCGGDDKTCGGNLTNEELPNTLGWPAACPNFERGSCDNAITDCGGIATCLVCLDNAAVEQAMHLYYDDLALPSSGTLNGCQATIGKATTAFLSAKSKALQKCWDATMSGKLAPGATCVDPDPGDGKYLGAIAKAELKKHTAICKACGGADGVCGGGDDMTPAMIGFPTTCPPVTPPGHTGCGGPITDLDSVVTCVDCVTEFKVDCLARAQVPQVTSYPTECGACVLPLATGPCPTSVQLTADGTASDYDVGFTGLAHNERFSSNTRLTLGVGACAGGSQPTCGQCNLTGPLPNAGGSAFDDRRCLDASWIACSTNIDCTQAGASGPCVDFWGPPVSAPVGGLGFCLTNVVRPAVSGTVNVDDGSLAAALKLETRIYYSSSLFHPCPVCDRVCLGGSRIGAPCTADAECPGSTCSAQVLCGDGPRQLMPCSPQGSGQFGNVSLDCPPAFDIGTQVTSLNLSTGTQSRTLGVTSPRCRETGYTTLSCFCNTCNNANAEPCFSDADCPLSGGNPGICGGRDCIGGGNDGAPCLSNTECPGGLCNRPGEATRPNTCVDDTSTPAIEGCQDMGNDEGRCAFGPKDNVCSLQPFRACTTAADCDPSPSCTECLPGQTCDEQLRACFTDNGVIGGSVSVTGSPDAPCGAISKSSVGALFCVPPVGATGVNSPEGLPGLGRLFLPVTAEFLP